MMWCRWIILTGWLCAAIVVEPCFASADDPVSYHQVRRWGGAVVQTPLGRLLHRSKPAWASTEPSLSWISKQGTALQSALPGADVRAVAVQGITVVAVVAQPRGLDVVILDRTLRELHRLPIPRSEPISVHERIELHASPVSSNVYLRLGSSLFLLRLADWRTGAPSIALVDDRVRSVCASPFSIGEMAFAHDVGGTAFVSVIDSTGMQRSATPVPLAEESRLQPLQRGVAMLAGMEDERQTQITIVDVETQDVRLLTVPAPRAYVDLAHVDTTLMVAAILSRGGRYEVAMWNVEQGGTPPESGIPLDRDLGLPIRLSIVGDKIYVMSRAGLVTMSTDGSVRSRDALPTVLDDASTVVQEIEDGVLLRTSALTVELTPSWQPWWWLLRALGLVWTAVVPLLLLSIIVWLYLQLRRQRRLFETMLQVPGAGLVFVIDGNGRLVRTNDRAAALVRISNRVPMGRAFYSYVRHAGLEGVQRFLDDAYTSQRPLSERVTVRDDDEQRDYVFTSIPMAGGAGRFRGIVATGVDITEALERRRLVNWAQLAHDMQTNLSTIRLNAEQLSREASYTTNERVRRILFQTQVLTQRVRDLVSVGRSEELQRTPVHSAEFCTQIRHEFDPEMFPNVTFSMKLRGAMMNVDRLKLSRAVRNAVENAIKALRGQQGTVEIATWADRDDVYIRVSDTGVGMDTLTLEQMMRPYFTTAQDGSGTGIGTMIMQHVTQLHGGTLRVTSEPGEGTHVVFRIPHGMHGGRHIATDRTSLLEVA